MRVIALMMEAASTSETLLNFYQTTWHNNPEDSHLQTLTIIPTNNTIINDNDDDDNNIPFSH
jgi:hypothetical protein